ncbi:unnamed protein product [Adineta ricciae]|uniref:LITAF domain-containing protein n=1 Tax=Adineta ricciae TaxID=249248 RepID=A0A815YS76_ADIRI|nr:unnamed protein product [Adineta ricciae]CAF1573518.1 unnamed protein product [Adineta ricciae]
MNKNYQESPPSYQACQEKPSAPRSPLITYERLSTDERIEHSRFMGYNEADLAMISDQDLRSVSVGHEPVQCICSNCRSSVVTLVKQTPGLLVWLLCLLIIIVGCWLGCCLIPFCIRGIKNTQHYCPNCKVLIGEYRPL